MKKRFIVVVAVLTIACVAFFGLTTTDTVNAAPAAAAGKTYAGTVYVSAMGGHFAVADVTIDPSKESPIVVNSLDKIDIGNSKTHPTHDPRIDAKDRNIMYWSTYKLDANNKVHVGASDLKTGKVIKDEAIDLDPRAKWTGALYCGSGQSNDFYIPLTMTDEAYIDVFDKKTMKLKHRVFLDYKPGETKFYHGTNTPDMKKFLVAVNLQTDGKLNGKIDLIMLDLKALENGKVKVLAKNTVTGEPGKTITFRQYFSTDGKTLYQSARDRMLVVDANTLKVVDEEMVPSGENHDVMPTPDGKYAVLTLREAVGKTADGKDIMDGTLQLYDVAAQKLVGKSSSACKNCHSAAGVTGSAILCGMDANWKM
ncbi:MAG TPA: hypothetical protein VN604_09445 [Nitrospirota bacterium]|nr:hypothetical protein [Nitrospirota bacterium]